MAALVGSTLLIGCGGSSGSSSANSGEASRSASGATDTATATTPHHGFGQAEVPARAACRRAVAKEPSVAASAKPEIDALCDRVNNVVEDNEASVRAVCQELASASSASSALARKRVFLACYAEYAKTVK